MDEEKLGHEERQYKNFLDQVSNRKLLDKAFKSLDKSSSPRFSLFSIIHCKETTLSRIICHLLDPQGTHGQGAVFLKKYLEMLRDKNGWEKYVNANGTGNPKKMFKESSVGKTIYSLLESSDDAFRTSYSNTEWETIDGRRIDVTTMLNGIFFGLENKIDAQEQRTQLADYAKEVLDQNKENGNDNSGFVVFLRKAKDMVPVTGGGLKEYIIPINYDDIRWWLAECLKDIDADNIRYHIKEVQKLIDGFYDRRNSMETNWLENLVEAHPELLQDVFYVHDNRDHLVTALVKDLSDYIKIQISLTPEWEFLDFGSDKTWFFPVKLKHNKLPGIYIQLEIGAKTKKEIKYGIKYYNYTEDKKEFNRKISDAVNSFNEKEKTKIKMSIDPESWPISSTIPKYDDFLVQSKIFLKKGTSKETNDFEERLKKMICDLKNYIKILNSISQ